MILKVCWSRSCMSNNEKDPKHLKFSFQKRPTPCSLIRPCWPPWCWWLQLFWRLQRAQQHVPSHGVNGGLGKWSCNSMPIKKIHENHTLGCIEFAIQFVPTSQFRFQVLSLLGNSHGFRWGRGSKSTWHLWRQRKSCSEVAVCETRSHQLDSPWRRPLDT